MAVKDNIKESLNWIYNKIISNPGNLVAFSVSFLFAVFFSVFSILQYQSLDDSAYDLGMHAQMIESFLHGELFYSPLIGESLLT